MTKEFYFVLIFSFTSALVSVAQEQTTRGESEELRGSESFEIQKEEKKKKTLSEMSRREYKKSFTYRYFKYHDDLVDEFYQRMKRVKKRNKKIARKMKKPKYSDPTYFGHRRKPKKREPGKMRMCDECGIKH